MEKLFEIEKIPPTNDLASDFAGVANQP